MMDRNAMLSRLLSPSPMEAQPGMTLQPPVVEQPVQPIGAGSIAQMDDADRRQQEINDREAARQQRARERLANRGQAQEGIELAPQESEDAVIPSPQYEDSYGIDDLISSEKSEAEGRMGELDRKPISEWSKKDWGSFLVDVGGGFSRAAGEDFGTGLGSASAAGARHLKDLDERAQKWDDRQRARQDDLDDMLLRDSIQRRRTVDDRAYDAQIRGEERDYRSGERQLDRLWDRDTYNRNRSDQLADREDARRYAGEQLKDERDYAEKAAAAANARADAKELRAAAAKNSRDYSEDYVKLATELNKARAESGDTLMSAEELDKIIIPQLRAAYGIGGALGGSSEAALPANTGLSSGY